MNYLWLRKKFTSLSPDLYFAFKISMMDWRICEAVPLTLENIEEMTKPGTQLFSEQGISISIKLYKTTLESSAEHVHIQFPNDFPFSAPMIWWNQEPILYPYNEWFPGETLETLMIHLHQHIFSEEMGGRN